MTIRATLSRVGRGFSALLGWVLRPTELFIKPSLCRGGMASAFGRRAFARRCCSVARVPHLHPSVGVSTVAPTFRSGAHDRSMRVLDARVRGARPDPGDSACSFDSGSPVVRGKNHYPFTATFQKFELLQSAGNKFDRSSLDVSLDSGFHLYECEQFLSSHELEDAIRSQAKSIRVKLVCSTVDPRAIPPQALDEYGKKYSADKTAWTFFCRRAGQRSKCWTRCVKLGDWNMDQSSASCFVNKQGRVRGYLTRCLTAIRSPSLRRTRLRSKKTGL